MTKPGGTHDEATRALISERTQQAMAAPEVRQRISERTKAGMAAASGSAAERAALRLAWRTARPSVRRAFLEELLGPVCSASAEMQHTSARRDSE
jgi:hypothetical protein